MNYKEKIAFQKRKQEEAKLAASKEVKKTIFANKTTNKETKK